jgi:hypothetical protein
MDQSYGMIYKTGNNKTGEYSKKGSFITKDYKSREEGCMTKMQNELNLPTLQSRRTAMPPDLQYTQGHIVIDVRRVGFDTSDNRSDGDRCNKKGHKTRVEPTGVVNKIKCLIAFNC